ncbi:hypothetical protein MKX03_021959 [Papaver bracteatum]|nr:hypothetical protein MKX03_021959 [Papaver bracteatum]
MIIPMDNYHMVHIGHGVFDTASIMDVHLYELDQHINRFLRSATNVKINLPFNRELIRSILMQTVAASKCREGSLRYWLSAGLGDFQLSPSSCDKSSVGNNMRFRFLRNLVHATNTIITKTELERLIELVDRGEVILFP